MSAQKQEVATRPDNTTNISDQSAMLAVIERAARDPQVDVAKMEKLMELQERYQARQAKIEFDAAMAEMQPELPSIGERGNAANRYTYALWEDINAAIKPILSKHGFSLSFRTDTAEQITVTGVLSHRAGHREETRITLPADGSGNKNAVQAVASSVSYCKRYAAGALLNLTSHGEDDDAFAAAEPDADPSWYDAIANASDMTELQKVAADLKQHPLSGRALRNVRAAWAKRSKELSA